MKSIEDVIEHIIDIDDLKQKYLKEFPTKSESDFYQDLKTYIEIEPFKINENISYDRNINITPEVHFIMRYIVTELLKLTFICMKVDLNDPNLSDEDSLGTPGRIAKMWLGKDIYDTDELLSGRWNPMPNVKLFPNESNCSTPITVKVDLESVCSHHLIPFYTENREDSYVLVSYIPRKYYVGISKISRLVQWIARRGWMQEELTEAIGKFFEKILETDSVLVKIVNAKHGCMSYRGARDRNSTTTTEYRSGEFLTKYRDL